MDRTEPRGGIFTLLEGRAMEGLHPHDSRKCAAPGCKMTAIEAHRLKLNNGTTLRYCSQDCQDCHEAFLKRRLPELWVES